jgi:hypothetical protein
VLWRRFRCSALTLGGLWLVSIFCGLQLRMKKHELYVPQQRNTTGPE